MAQKTTKNGQESDDKIVKRLNIVINLLIEMVRGDSSSRERIKLLSDAGLNYNEISSILNVSSNYVAVELSTLKKKNKKIKEVLKNG